MTEGGGSGARLGRWFRGIGGAFGFLTVIPVAARARRSVTDTGTAYFPAVGLLTGGVLVVVREAAGGGLLGAALAVFGAVALTGGLHEDGWADTADALGAPVDRDRRRAILGDPRVGAHALWASVLLILIRVTAVAGAGAVTLVTGAILGRLVMVYTLRFAPVLPESSLGRSTASGARPLVATLVATTLVVPMALVGGVGRNLPVNAVPAPADVSLFAMSVGGALLIGLAFTLLVMRRLGGFGGDAHGATGLLVETSCWTLGAVLI